MITTIILLFFIFFSLGPWWFFFPPLTLLKRLYSHTHLKQKLPIRDYTPEGCEFYYFPLHLAKHFPVLWMTSILYLQQNRLDWNKGISYRAVTFAGLYSKMYNWGGGFTRQLVIRVQSPARKLSAATHRPRSMNCHTSLPLHPNSTNRFILPSFLSVKVDIQGVCMT